MKKMYLTSSFEDVARLFEELEGEHIRGKCITFIPTASIVENYTDYVKSGRKALEKMGFIVDELELSTALPEEISKKLERNDAIYISGGNTFFLLQELKRTGADKLIIEQVKSGKLFIGESAGSMITSPNIAYAKDMDDFKQAPALENFDALTLVDFYPVPHYTNSPFKKTAESILSKYQESLNLYPISNCQMIYVADKEPEIMSK